MSSDAIKTLSSLKREKRKLKTRMKFTREKLSKSAGHTMSRGGRLLIKKTFFRWGALSLGLLATRKIFKRFQSGRKLKGTKAYLSKNWFAKFLHKSWPLAMRIFVPKAMGARLYKFFQ